MKTLYGMHRPDEGTIALDGEVVVLTQPERRHRARRRHGAPALQAGRQPHGPRERRAGRRAHQARLRSTSPRPARRIAEISDRYGLDVDPDALVEDLGVGERQRVEILKVLYRGARTLILDEPTAVLVPQEVDELFDALRELKAEGLAILFISHKLDEVLKVADEITVIRRGTTVATVRPADVTARQLAELMVGSELPDPETRESTVTDVEELVGRGPHASSTRTGARCSRTSPSPSTAARSSASPASRATARPSSSRRSWGCAGRRPGTVHARRRGHRRAGRPAGAARPASPTSPRTASGTACCSSRRCGRTACSATRRSRRTQGRR